jgi:ATP-dependent DNA helicase RecG
VIQFTKGPSLHGEGPFFMPQNINIEDNLSWFNTPVQFAKGVGPYLSKLLGKLNIANIEDLIYHIPFRYLDRRQISSIKGVKPGKGACVMGEIYAAGEVLLNRRGRKIYEVILSDGEGFLTAKWFHYPKKFFQNRFKKGEKFLFFGEITSYRGEKQMVHPEVQAIKEFFDED